MWSHRFDISEPSAVVARRTGMTRRVSAIALALLVATTACAKTDSPSASAPSSESTAAPSSSPVPKASSEPVPSAATSLPASAAVSLEPPHSTELERPPAVVVRSKERAHTIDPYIFCFGSGCADGPPPDNPPDVGATDEVRVEFPLPDWTFKADFQAPGEQFCTRQFPAPVSRNDDGSFTIRPSGHPGTYDVVVVGRGEQRGDVIVRFLWSTTMEGPLPKPEVSLSVSPDRHGKLDNFNASLYLAQLPATPKRAVATITVRPQDGGSPVSVTVSDTPNRGCTIEGAVMLSTPPEQGLVKGERPPKLVGRFTVEVELELDGVRHTGTTTLPWDEPVNGEPSGRLTLTPPLPALK